MTRPPRESLRDARGYTLTELAVTLALFGMLMAGVMMTWSKTQQAYFVGSEAAENQQNVRAAIDFMVRELSPLYDIRGADGASLFSPTSSKPGREKKPSVSTADAPSSISSVVTPAHVTLSGASGPAAGASKKPA